MSVFILMLYFGDPVTQTSMDVYQSAYECESELKLKMRVEIKHIGFKRIVSGSCKKFDLIKESDSG